MRITTRRIAVRLAFLLLAGLVTAGCDPAGARRVAVGGPGCPEIAGQRVRWIVPYSPGGGYDVTSRLLQTHLERRIGARILIENRVGVGGRVGARTIRDARPDGRTIGIINATSLFVGELAEGLSGLHPVDDFTVLGRIGLADPVWVTASRSPLGSIEDVLASGSRQPLLFGISDIGSSGFISASGAADLLGIEVDFLLGYPGNQEAALGLIRGELDLGGFTFESMLDRIEGGDLTPVLQISDEPISDHPSLEGVPLLAGPDGLAARLARERGEDPNLAISRTEALVRIFQVGRLVVGPPGMAPELAECLSEALAEVVRDPEFGALTGSARRSFAFEGPADVLASLEATAAARLALAPLFRHHIEKVRSGARR